MTVKSRSDLLVDEYLSRLNDALAKLPASRRSDILDDVRSHILEGRKQASFDDEAAIRNILDRIGDPETIAAEELSSSGVVQATRSEKWVPWLLLLGGFLLVVGWLVGIYLLWRSSVWSLRDKLLGTLLLPGGLLPFWYLLTRPITSPSCTREGGAGRATVTHCLSAGGVLPIPLTIAIVAVALLGPVFVAVHLNHVRAHSR